VKGHGAQGIGTQLFSTSNSTATPPNVEQWAPNRKITINGYGTLECLQEGLYVGVDFWRLPVVDVQRLDNVCVGMLSSLQKILRSDVCVNNEGVVAWAHAVLSYLPEFECKEQVAFERAKLFQEDVTHKTYKNAYYSYLPTWNWEHAHPCWVLGDGACLFNSVIALLTGRGVHGCLTTRDAKYVIGAYTLRLACICKEIVTLPYIRTLSDLSIASMQRSMAGRCGVCAWVAEEEAAALALLLRKPIQLMSPRWQQSFAPYGLFSSGSQDVDTSKNPLVIMWCRYMTNNVCDNVAALHGAEFNANALNHFIPCFVADQISVVRLKYLSTLKWNVNELVVSRVWNNPFILLPIATNLVDRHIIGMNELGHINVPYIYEGRLDMRYVWDEMTWLDNVQRTSVTMSNDHRVLPTHKETSHPKARTLRPTVEMQSPRKEDEQLQGVNICKEKKDAKQRSSMPVVVATKFVAAVDIVGVAKEYFVEVYSKVFAKFVNVKDVDIRLVEKTLSGLPNDLYDVLDIDVTKFCYEWLGDRRHVKIYEMSQLVQMLEHTCSRPECLVFTFQVLALVILYSVKDRAIARAIARAIDRAIDRALVYRTVVRYGNVSVRSVHICCIDMVRKTHTS
jgi:hypothetical protein